jgi:4-carboxymuconolactone decarboxylase
MARVSLIDPQNRPDLSGLIAKITGARGGRLINVYRMLLHSPAVTEAWLNFISSLRTGTEIDEKTKELVIMRVAILNRVDYVLNTHVQIYAPKAGVTREQIDTLANWPSSTHFSDHERALLAYVDAMTEEIEVPDAVFEALRSHYSERQVVEITVLIGTYNMHTRVLQALRIDPESPPSSR